MPRERKNEWTEFSSLCVVLLPTLACVYIAPASWKSLPTFVWIHVNCSAFSGWSLHRAAPRWTLCCLFLSLSVFPSERVHDANSVPSRAIHWWLSVSQIDWLTAFQCLLQAWHDLNGFIMLTYLVLSRIWWGSNCYCSHFTDKVTEAHGGKGTFPLLLSEWVSGWQSRIWTRLSLVPGSMLLIMMIWSQILPILVWGLFLYLLSLGCSWDLLWAAKHNESDAMWLPRLGLKRLGSVWLFLFWNAALGPLRKEAGLGYGCLRGCVEENRGTAANSLHESLAMLLGWGHLGPCSPANFPAHAIM